MTRTPLTPIEEQVYHFLLDFLAERTFQPSVREIAERFSIASTKSVADLLASLERKGYIEREAGRSRGVTLLGFAGGAGTVPVPVMRPDGARRAMLDDGFLTIARTLIHASDAFLTHAFPDGAEEIGVLEGDLLIVHPSERARDGDAVVDARRTDRPLAHRRQHADRGVLDRTRIERWERDSGLHRRVQANRIEYMDRLR